MKILIHDLGKEYTGYFKERFDEVFDANGKYSFCQGCFGCWISHPGECVMNDSLKYFGASIGKANDVVVVSKNCYGSFSPEVKTILERGIGASTPMTTIKKKETHHVARYTGHEHFKVFAYGDMSENEKETFEYVTGRTARNYNFEKYAFEVLEDVSKLKDIEL